ncbi:hypothetical protein K438DRAFT_2003071 [Mycena galopus ATCC 62051]|nr:hypothetical protein K438DRAFT_2003071 [Mycena galopus ATCC 62051]
MCDTVSVLLGALSLLPDNRYILVALGLVGLTFHIINGQRPSNKLDRIEVMIKSLQKSLKDEKEDCVGSHFELVDVMSCLFEPKLSASKMRVRLLESRSVTTWNEFVEYLQYLREIIQDINQCTKKVKEVRASMLRIIEGELQQQFSAGIQQSREILEKITSRRRGSNAAATRKASYDSM